MELIKNLKWRYATKKFNSSKKVSQENLEKLKEAVQLSVSSYGLQMYKVLIIENSDIREELKPASWNQNQITDASHLFVFCHFISDLDKEVDNFIELTAKTRNLNKERLVGYGDFIKTKIGEKTATERISWLKSQTYLALGNLISACAELQIDACPMEGFEIEKYNQILNLTERGLSASVIAPIGYRHQEDETSYLEKVRKPFNELFEFVV